MVLIRTMHGTSARVPRRVYRSSYGGKQASLGPPSLSRAAVIRASSALSAPAYKEDQLRLGSEIDFTGGMQAVMQNADPARLAALLDSIWEHRSISTPIRGPN